MAQIPGDYDLTIIQGATFNLALTYKDDADAVIELADYTALLQMRKSAKDDTVLVELSTENDGITVADTAPNIVLAMEAIVTEEIEWRNAVYDLRLEASDGTVTRLLQGDVVGSPAVSRDEGT